MLSLALALGGVGFISLLLALRGRGVLAYPVAEFTGGARGPHTVTGGARGSVSATVAARGTSVTMRGVAT